MNPANIFLEQLVQKHRSPSVQYIFFNQEEVIHSYTNGYANLEEQIRATQETTYNAYSMTKTFTALAVLQLADKGKLKIDDPIVEYLPGLPYPDNITIRQLMAHSAGIPNPIPLRWVHLPSEEDEFDSQEFFKEKINKHNKVNSEPNQKFAYSNLGYIILGQLIAQISGKNYEDYVLNSIIKPLGVDANMLDFRIRDEEKHAKGYHLRNSLSYWILGLLMDKKKYMNTKEGKWRSFNDMYVNGAAFGGLIGNARGFRVYIQELLKKDPAIISKESRELLFTENITESGKSTGMCLSWFTGELKGKPYLTHVGGGGGYYCEMRIYRKLGLGSVIMFNRSGMKDERFLDKVDSSFI